MIILLLHHIYLTRLNIVNKIVLLNKLQKSLEKKTGKKDSEKKATVYERNIKQICKFSLKNRGTTN